MLLFSVAELLLATEEKLVEEVKEVAVELPPITSEKEIKVPPEDDDLGLFFDMAMIIFDLLTTCLYLLYFSLSPKKFMPKTNLI